MTKIRRFVFLLFWRLIVGSRSNRRRHRQMIIRRNKSLVKGKRPSWRHWVNKDQGALTGGYYEFKTWNVYWAYRCYEKQEVATNMVVNKNRATIRIVNRVTPMETK